MPTSPKKKDRKVFSQEGRRTPGKMGGEESKIIQTSLGPGWFNFLYGITPIARIYSFKLNYKSGAKLPGVNSRQFVAGNSRNRG